MPPQFKIESLLSARLFLSPQLVGERIYFISDLSGRLSLYAMDKNGSVPEPLLPRDLALFNPALLEGGEPFFVYPQLGKIVVMVDHEGDENFQPTFIPLEGGIPEPIFGERFAGQQVILSHGDLEKNIAVFQVDPRTNPNNQAFLANLRTRELTDLGTSLYGNFYLGSNSDFSKIVLADQYLPGDEAVFLWERAIGQRRLLYGKPMEQRQEGETVPPNSISSCYFTDNDRGLLFVTTVFDDHYGLGYFPLDAPQDMRPVEIVGATHSGAGEIKKLLELEGTRYLLEYNIDGVSYVYTGSFDETKLRLTLNAMPVGAGVLSSGVLEHLDYEKATGNFALSFSTATSPSQLFTISEGAVKQLTRERALGIPPRLMSPGEDVSFTSHDGLRVSARLYMPATELGFEGKRPVIYYIHGGPQGQERPDFTWFSMPLIQFFTLNGFAVFVPNVRGSTGYGLDYMSRVDHDWGGQDRLDHLAALEHLRGDARLDLSRVGVMGRSYGGYMTLTLAGRHPELWRAACDMFGPYDLLTFVERMPETWKTYFYLELGHPIKDRDLYIERSPSTYLHQLACPMLVIQGGNDPRVVQAESLDLVEQLRAQGKQMELIIFDNEGHDVLKFENKVRCYSEIVRFFSAQLKP